MYAVLGGIFVSLLLGYRPPVWEVALWPPITALWVATAHMWMKTAEMRKKQSARWEAMAERSASLNSILVNRDYPVIIPGNVENDA